ncbi:MAG TPA: acyltransferase [Pirellula sp.]|nr:acyltransferase [Pirellula sp.]
MRKLVSSADGLDSIALLSPLDTTQSYVKPGEHIPLLDVCKGIAAGIIVVHHLVEYSPSSHLADQFAPRLLYGVYYYGLFVVHLFLVFGGFGLAIATPDNPISLGKAFSSLVSRYIRLAAPYLVMLSLLVAVSFSTLSRGMDPPLIDSFSWLQLLAHLFFLQDILGFGNLSAGTWYLCIDIQYVALFLLIQVLIQAIGKSVHQNFSGPVAMSTVLVPLGMLSTWSWSRVLENDIYVFYFLGSLVLGTLVGWTLQGRIPWLVFPAYAFAMAASLAIEFRGRVVVALGSSLILYIGLRLWPKLSFPPALIWLGQVSYSLFLIHYLVNGLVLHGLNPWIGGSPFRAFAAMVIAFMTSLLAATALYCCVEAPCHRWVKLNRSKRIAKNADFGNTNVRH